MAVYSIKNLEVLTGIKAHTIRIWEKRYNIVEPQRTYTNIRCYTDNDLKKLLNISLLNRNGFKISNIAEMDKEEVKKNVLTITHQKIDEENQIEGLIIAMIEMDELKFSELIDQAIEKIGLEDTIVKIIYPFFERIGILWQINAINPAQEHFISNLTREKIIVATHKLPYIKAKKDNKFLLFLPEGELHELGLLFNYYLIKKNGFHVTYLGQSVPFDDIEQIVKIRKPNFALTYFITPLSDEDFQTYIKRISSILMKQKLFISGLQTKNKKIPNSRNIVNFSSIAEFKGHLEKLN